MRLYYLHSAVDFDEQDSVFNAHYCPASFHCMATCTTPLMSNEANNFSNQEIYSSLLNQEDTEKVKYGRHPCHISLNAQQLMICQAKNTSKVLAKISADSIIGATAVLKGKCHQLEIFYYPLATGCCVSHKDGSKRVRKTIALNFMEDQTACQNWMNVIRYVSSGLTLPVLYAPQQGDVEVGDQRASREGSILRVTPPPTRNFLVVVNPVGGKRQGRQIWKKWLEPMLREANVVVTLLITERADHAKNMLSEMQTDPAATYQAILCVGGDGIVFEVVNGLIHRAGGEELLKRLPIVHIPGGTGNGLSKSVLFACNEACTPLNAAFVALRGHPQSLDLARVTTVDGKEHISFLSLAWGLISDVDILSETMRYLGETRLYIAAVYFMIRRRFYAGRLRMKLIESDEAPDSVGNNSNGSAGTVDEDGWTTIESPFLLFWAVQTSHTAITIHSGPGVKLDDGIFTIAVCQEMSRFHMIELLLGMDSGAHYQHPKVKVFRCREYTLEPLTDKGIYSLDGEVVPYGKVSAVVLPSAATTLSL